MHVTHFCAACGTKCCEDRNFRNEDRLMAIRLAIKNCPVKMIDWETESDAAAVKECARKLTWVLAKIADLAGMSKESQGYLPITRSEP